MTNLLEVVEGDGTGMGMRGMSGGTGLTGLRGPGLELGALLDLLPLFDPPPFTGAGG